MVAEAPATPFMKPTRTGQPLLEVTNLKTQFMTQDGVVSAR